VVTAVNDGDGPGAVRAGLSLLAGVFVIGLIDLLRISFGPAADAAGVEQLSRFVPLLLIAAPAAVGLLGVVLAELRRFLVRRAGTAIAEGATDLLAAAPLLACIPGTLCGPAISGSPWRWPLGLAAAATTIAGAALLRRGALRGAARVETCC